MPLDVTLLLTRPQCDAVTEELDKRLRLLSNREENFEYRDEVGTERATELNEELAGLNQRIASLDAYLPTLTAGTAEQKRAANERRRADDRRGEVLAQQDARGGVPAVLAQSLLREIQSRTAVINEDKAQVAAHRNTLPA
ncbi:hypothetical protein [Hymenobacter koreensis]|uniref:Uncharacterized protein n=1 Tax=Hymenobacter koreensis TaxID=1084523 RepID=A0ABP8JL37_9BACT